MSKRAAFRREQKMQNKMYTLSQKQINDLKAETVNKATKDAFLLMLSIPTSILADNYWKKSANKRIPEFTDLVLSLYKDFENGKVKIDQLNKRFEELSGMKIGTN